MSHCLNIVRDNCMQPPTQLLTDYLGTPGYNVHGIEIRQNDRLSSAQ